MERSKDSSHKWDAYYARTAVLPKPEIAARFLDKIPQDGHILDFGAGSGRWSAAFLRDRPDLTIDALDQNIDQATLLPETWRGEKIKSSFQAFEPSKSYDGIWAFATLFFMEKKESGECFHKLATSLKEGGTISFTMVDDCHAASASKFHGLSKSEILDMLGKEGLNLTSLELNEQATYGPAKTVIPTYTVTASKVG
jgi:trans-aconitate methyltransferase